MAYLDSRHAVLALAHRGFALDGRENSAMAFQAARDLGLDHVETDAHATADGVAVALHDALLDRTTDATGAVAALTWQQVARARIGGTEPVPRLVDLLGAWPDLAWNIDVKAAASGGQAEVVALLAAAALPWPLAVRAAAAALAQVDAVQVPQRAGVPVVTARTVRLAHAVGRQVHVWTVDEPAAMTRLLDLGVDGLVTNRADLVRQVLLARGAW